MHFRCKVLKEETQQSQTKDNRTSTLHHHLIYNISMTVSLNDPNYDKNNIKYDEYAEDEFKEKPKKPKQILSIPDELTFPVQVIPPNDISFGIQKQILQEGEGLQATEGSKIRYLHKGFVVYENGDLIVIDDNYSHPQERLFKPNSLLSFFGPCLYSMKLKEKSLFRIAPEHGYGNKHTPFSGISDPRLEDGIPANSALVYYLEVTYLERKRPAPTSFEECIKYAVADRLEGNEHYKNRKFKEALNMYNRSKSILQQISSADKNQEENISIIEDASKKTYLNLIKAYLEAAAEKSCSEGNRKKHLKVAIELTKNSVLNGDTEAEACYLRAKAQSANNDYDRAVESVEKALELNPKLVNAQNLKSKLLKEQKIQHVESQKKLKSKMTNFFNKGDQLYPDAKPHNMMDQWQKLDAEDKRLGRQVWFTGMGEEIYLDASVPTTKFEDVTDSSSN
jgi:tetratricopeptide (TPR) repeat protein